MQTVLGAKNIFSIQYLRKNFKVVHNIKKLWIWPINILKLGFYRELVNKINYKFNLLSK